MSIICFFGHSLHLYFTWNISHVLHVILWTPFTFVFYMKYFTRITCYRLNTNSSSFPVMRLNILCMYRYLHSTKIMKLHTKFKIILVYLLILIHMCIIKIKIQILFIYQCNDGNVLKKIIYIQYIFLTQIRFAECN